MGKRKAWADLKPDYRHRLERQGITPAMHKTMTTEELRAARGKAHTPEHPPIRKLNPPKGSDRLAEYVVRRRPGEQWFRASDLKAAIGKVRGHPKAPNKLRIAVLGDVQTVWLREGEKFAYKAAGGSTKERMVPLDGGDAVEVEVEHDVVVGSASYKASWYIWIEDHTFFPVRGKKGVAYVDSCGVDEESTTIGLANEAVPVDQGIWVEVHRYSFAAGAPYEDTTGQKKRKR